MFVERKAAIIRSDSRASFPSMSHDFMTLWEAWLAVGLWRAYVGMLRMGYVDSRHKTNVRGQFSTVLQYTEWFVRGAFYPRCCLLFAQVFCLGQLRLAWRLYGCPLMTLQLW